MAGSSSGLQAAGSVRGVRRQGDGVAARKLEGGRRRWLRHGRQSSHGHASPAGKSVTGTSVCMQFGSSILAVASSGCGMAGGACTGEMKKEQQGCRARASLSELGRNRKEQRHAMEGKQWQPLMALITCGYWRNEETTVSGEVCDAGGEQDISRED
jgi:hypothetical protein